MRRILLGVLIGVVGTMLVQKAWVAYRVQQYQASPDLELPDVVEHTINHGLPGAIFREVSWTASAANVNFAHDRLYDAHVTYERNGQIKRFTAVFGYSEKPRAWLSPTTLDLEILDDKAEIVHRREGAAEPTPSNDVLRTAPED